MTNPSVAEFDPSFAHLRRDVVVAANGSMASFRFRKGKPDKTNKGSQRFILQGPLGAAFCPVRFLKQSRTCGTTSERINERQRPGHLRG